MGDFANLIERVKRCKEADNALDVEIEIATFEPDRIYKSVCANNAGTKVIFTYQDGGKETFWARDWTLTRTTRANAIKALATRTTGDDNDR